MAISIRIASTLKEIYEITVDDWETHIHVDSYQEVIEAIAHYFGKPHKLNSAGCVLCNEIRRNAQK